jgi:ketosteroid isomerase-like protein
MNTEYELRTHNLVGRLCLNEEDNKALLRHVYEELSKGNREPLLEALADDISWTIIGTTVVSGTYRGKKDVFEKLFVPIRARLSSPIVFRLKT